MPNFTPWGRLPEHGQRCANERDLDHCRWRSGRRHSHPIPLQHRGSQSRPWHAHRPAPTTITSTSPAIAPGRASTGINLNSQYAHSQVLGSAVFRRLELPMAESRPVQVRVNSTNLMAVDGQQFLRLLCRQRAIQWRFCRTRLPPGSLRQFLPRHPRRNRSAMPPATASPICPGTAPITPRPPTPTPISRKTISWKTTCPTSSICIAVLNTQNGYVAANYVPDIQRRINVDEWMQYMAANTLLDNERPAWPTASGMITRSIAAPTTRGSWRSLMTWIPSWAGARRRYIRQNDIWAMTNLATMNKFMKTPEFAPLYYNWLKTYCDTSVLAGADESSARSTAGRLRAPGEH